MQKINFFKKLPQRLFPWFIGVGVVFIIFDASKKHLNFAHEHKKSISYDEALAKIEAPTQPIPEDVLKSLDVKPKPNVILNSDALTQLNESIRSISLTQTKQIKTETLHESELIPAKPEKVKEQVATKRCAYQGQDYLPGDLIKTDTGWMRCAHIFDFSANALTRNVSWIEVR